MTEGGSCVRSPDKNGRRHSRRCPTAIRGLAWVFLALTLSTGVLQAAPRVGDILPKTTLGDLKGAPVAIPDDYKGKVVLIHFFATWCTYCPKEVAVLDAIYRKYRDKGVVPCSVDVGESRDEVDSFAADQRISYPSCSIRHLRPRSSMALQASPQRIFSIARCRQV